MNVIERFRKYRKGGLIYKYLEGKKILDLGETISDKQLKEIIDMYNYLTSVKKLSKRNASAIMGNVWQESRFDDTKVSSKGATGFLQFLGDRDKDYKKWLALNPKAHKKYSQLDYILSSIANNTGDLYRQGYEGVIKRINDAKQVMDTSTGKNKVARQKEYKSLVDYKDKVYGKREKAGQLYFFEDLNNSMNNPSLSTDSITKVWHHTVERSNPKETNMDNRLNAANAFYNYFE